MSTATREPQGLMMHSNGSDTVAGPMASRPSYDAVAILEDAPWTPLQSIVVAICMGVIFVDGADRTGLGLVAKNLIQSLHTNATHIGIVFSMDNLGAVVGALLCGRLSDRFGSKQVMLVTLAIIAAATLCTPYMTTVLALGTMRFIAGLGLGGAVPAALTLASDFVKPALRGSIAALVFAGYTTGAACGGLWSAYLLAHFPWQSLFYVGTALPVLVLILTFFLVPEPLERLLQTKQLERATRIVARLRADLRATQFDLHETASQRKTETGGLRALFTGGLAMPTIFLWLIYIFMFSTLRFAVGWLPSILTTNGLSPSEAATAQAMWNTGSLAGELAGVRVVKIWGGSASMFPSLLLAGVGFCLLGFHLSSLYWVIALLIIAGLGAGVATSGIVASTASVYPTHLRGTGIGAGFASARFGQVISPPLIGLLLDTSLGAHAVLLIVAGLPFAAAASILPFRAASRRLPKESHSPAA